MVAPPPEGPSKAGESSRWRVAPALALPWPHCCLRGVGSLCKPKEEGASEFAPRRVHGAGGRTDNG